MSGWAELTEILYHNIRGQGVTEDTGLSSGRKDMWRHPERSCFSSGARDLPFALCLRGDPSGPLVKTRAFGMTTLDRERYFMSRNTRYHVYRTVYVTTFSPSGMIFTGNSIVWLSFF